VTQCHERNSRSRRPRTKERRPAHLRTAGGALPRDRDWHIDASYCVFWRGSSFGLT
jgi:hypothetical protein